MQILILVARHGVAKHYIKNPNSDLISENYNTYLLPTANSFRIFWLTCTVLSICPVPASANTTSASPKNHYPTTCINQTYTRLLSRWQENHELNMNLPMVGVSNIGICLIKANLSPTKWRPGVKKTSRNPIGLALRGIIYFGIDSCFKFE